jgi:hypothetical protein
MLLLEAGEGSFVARGASAVGGVKRVSSGWVGSVEEVGLRSALSVATLSSGAG